MSPTDTLIRAAAALDTDRHLGRAPRDAALLAGVAASEVTMPADARDAARRHLAIAEWLRAWAVHEDAERAAELEDRAAAQDALVALLVVGGERYTA